MKTRFAILACLIAIIAGCEGATPAKSANDADAEHKLEEAQKQHEADVKRHEEDDKKLALFIAGGGCTKDAECKGDRVCTDNQCVERSARPNTPQPGAPPAQPGPQQQTLASGTVMWVPVASGAYCSAQKSLSFYLNNYTDEWLAEVRGPLVGLNCDGGSFTVATVTRRNGVIDRTWAVPPDINATFVTLPMNRGLGNVRITIDLFLNLGPQAPAQAIGYIVDHFHFPRMGGGAHFHDIREGGGGIQFYSLLEGKGSGTDVEVVMYDSLSEEQIDGLVAYMPVIPTDKLARLMPFVPSTRLALILSMLPSTRIAQLEELTHTTYQL